MKALRENLLVEAESDDIVWRDGYRPVTLASVGVGFRIVWGQDHPAGACKVPTTWSYE